MQVRADLAIIVEDLVDDSFRKGLSANGEVCCDRDLDLARKEVGDRVVIFNAKQIACHDCEREVVLRVEDGELAKGSRELAIDIAEDETEE